MFELNLFDLATDSGSGRDARLARIEKKLDLLLEHLDLAPQDDPAWMKSVKDLVGEGQNIAAIRVVRKATGLGLKEAKALVDSLARGEKLPYFV